jgi:hypothetical protein
MVEVSVQFVVATPRRLGPERDEVRPGGEPARRPVEVKDRRPQATPQPVAHDRGTDLAADGVRDAHVTGSGSGEVRHRHRPAPRSSSLTSESIERRTVADPTDQAESRARPFCRRVRTIARPARVFMR